MTIQLKQAIQIAQSLPLSQQLELLTALSDSIRKNHLREKQTQTAEANWGKEVLAKIDAAVEVSEHIAPIDGETFVYSILEQFQQL